MINVELLPIIVITSSMVTATSTLILAGYVWSRRPAAGAVHFLFFMLAVASWALGQTLEMITGHFALKFLFLLVQFAGICFAPYFWLLFAFRYTGREQLLSLRVQVALVLLPLCIWLLAATNGVHLQIWRSIMLNAADSYLPLQTVYGCGFWIGVAYGAGMVALGGFLFIRAFSSQRFYRSQVLLLSLCGAVSTLGVGIHIFGPSALQALQPVSITFAIATTVAAFTVIHYRIFDVVPVARGRLVDRMVDGVVILDVKDRVIDMNIAAEAILGRPAAAAVGRQVADVLQEFPQLLDAFYDDNYRQTEVHVRNQDRDAVYELSLARLHETNRGPSGRLLMLHDISDRKKLERIRHDLTYTMVHDLRNPITSNLTMLQMLEIYLDDLSQKDRQEMISAALTSMRRTLKLVDQIMEVNSLESGKVPIDLAVFPLAPMASDFLPSLFSLAAEKEIQLNNDIPTDLPAVYADPELIARVFQNLVGNALKFTPEGGLIRVTAAQQGDRIIVYVTDTGPGIAPEVRDRLFEKFAVGPNRGRGSGLGLAFCKMVIEAQGQEIWVESSSNAGTTFAFSLAVATEANVTEFAGAAAPDAAEEQETQA